MNIGEYFRTMVDSTSIIHSEHLMTHRYASHKALNDFYDESPEAIDMIIESYQGIYGVVTQTDCLLDSRGKSPKKYLIELKKFVVSGREELIDKEDTELWSNIDNFISLIDGTLYKLKELTEHLNSTSVNIVTYLISKL